MYKLDHRLSLIFTFVKSFQYMLAIIIFLLLLECTMKILSVSISFNAGYQVPDTYLALKCLLYESVQFSSVSQSCPTLSTPWTAARQASLSITNSRSLLKLMSIKSGMPSNHFILCCPFLFPPSIFPSIRVFSSESVLHIRWPKY